MMDEKKLHTREFQLKGIGGRVSVEPWDRSCFKKGLLEKQHLWHIASEKDI